MAGTKTPPLQLQVPPARSARLALTDAAFGVVLTIALVLLLGVFTPMLWITDIHISLIVSYLAAWVPFVGAVLVACYLHGTGSLVRDFGLRFRPLDLVWGLSIALLARGVAILIEVAVYGQPVSGVVMYGARDGWWLFGTLLAPVLLAPFIEEVFFRGLVLRAVQRSTSLNGGSKTVAAAIAVAVSGLIFALVHVLQVRSMETLIVMGLSTLVLGLAAATIAVRTGRLGGAIIAHVTFNALVMVPLVVGV